jgi:hypothetical protein
MFELISVGFNAATVSDAGVLLTDASLSSHSSRFDMIDDSKRYDLFVVCVSISDTNRTGRAKTKKNIFVFNKRHGKSITPFVGDNSSYH